jgi:MarR family 2-MHQ and catechol resistance regulon transcriptional repressor
MPEDTEDLSGVHVWLILMKAHAALLSHVHENIRDLGLCDSDFYVLEVLLHKGPLPVNVIGQKVNLTSGSISIAIDRLVQKRLVDRCEQAEDRRVRMVALTAEGRALIEKSFRTHALAMEKAAEGLDLDQRKQIIFLLKKLGKTAESSLLRRVS